LHNKEIMALESTSKDETWTSELAIEKKHESSRSQWTWRMKRKRLFDVKQSTRWCIFCRAARR
jgi:hypothetical protein